MTYPLELHLIRFIFLEEDQSLVFCSPTRLLLCSKEKINLLSTFFQCDLPNPVVSDQELSKFSIDNGFIGWFPTSAKEGKNIEEAMTLLVKTIMMSLQPNGNYPRADGSFKLLPTKSKDTSKKGEQQQPPEDSCCFLGGKT